MGEYKRRGKEKGGRGRRRKKKEKLYRKKRGC